MLDDQARANKSSIPERYSEQVKNNFAADNAMLLQTKLDERLRHQC
jgi:hypothetical protein